MKINVLRNCPISYDVVFFKSKGGTPEVETEFEEILKEASGTQWFSFYNLEAAIEFVYTKLNEEQNEFQYVEIMEDIFDSEDNWEVIDSEIVWACEVTED